MLKKTNQVAPSTAALRAARALRIRIHAFTGSPGSGTNPDDGANKKWLDSVTPADAEIIDREFKPLIDAVCRLTRELPLRRDWLDPDLEKTLVNAILDAAPTVPLDVPARKRLRPSDPKKIARERCPR